MLILPYFLENALVEILAFNTFTIVENQINKFIDLLFTETLEIEKIWVGQLSQDSLRFMIFSDYLLDYLAWLQTIQRLQFIRPI